ncbi:hypothetical protein [Levilactobacillus angrenensis]|uniref:Alpha/beta hydrolase n=1 Tax=Levilactobacillus angrenensis TaxID=2486020 RepID=A0ABW1U9Q0_9LACO|nr:hypothetical protein [Levilactobacillus angrenensis]
MKKSKIFVLIAATLFLSGAPASAFAAKTVPAARQSRVERTKAARHKAKKPKLKIKLANYQLESSGPESVLYAQGGSGVGADVFGWAMSLFG